MFLQVIPALSLFLMAFNLDLVCVNPLNQSCFLRSDHETCVSTLFSHHFALFTLRIELNQTIQISQEIRAQILVQIVESIWLTLSTSVINPIIESVGEATIPSNRSASHHPSFLTPTGQEMWRPNLSTCRSSLRILHATDIHFLVPPGLRQVLSAPKRLVGLTNLYLFKRANRFHLNQQRELVESILSQKPDIVVLSGDLTNLALREEFALAREILNPILDNNGAFPTVIIPGNHDAYADEAIKDPRTSQPISQLDSGTRGRVAAYMMREYFGPWMESMDESEYASKLQLSFTSNQDQFLDQLHRQQAHFMKFTQESIPSHLRVHPAESDQMVSPLPYLPVFGFDFLRIMTLNACQPTWLSDGLYEKKQLEMLQSLLRNSPMPVRGSATSWQSTDPTSDLDERTSPEQTKSAASSSALLPFTSTYNLLMGHYPILTGHGQPYEQKHPVHGVKNGSELRQILQSEQNKVKPHLYLHGHVHHGFQDQLPLDGDLKPTVNIADHDQRFHSTLPRHQMLIYNPGSSGYIFNGKSKRTSAYNIYTIERGLDLTTAPSTATLPASLVPDPTGSVTSSSSRTFPFPQSRPPFPPIPRATATELAESPYKRAPGRLADECGAQGGVESIYQPANDRKEKYFMTMERILHNGEEYGRELFPYTSGF